MPVGFFAMQILSVVADAVRGVRRSRGTALVVCPVLAVAMTVSVVTYSVIYGVLLRPLPYDDPARLISISEPSPFGVGVHPASPSEYFAWREGTHTLEAVAGARLGTARLDLGSRTEGVRVRLVTANLFDLLGVHAFRGRLFSARDDAAAADAAVLSYDAWVRLFAATPDTIGQIVRTDAGARRIVGVLQRDVMYPITTGPPPDLYMPLIGFERERANDRCCLIVVARLRSGVTLDEARADITHASSAVVLPLLDQVVGPAKAPLRLALAAVAFVLLVAYVNVACLWLARAVERIPEFATRQAIGAPVSRVAATMLLEGTLVSLVASGVAAAASGWFITAARAQMPPGVTRVSGIALNVPVLAAAITAALVCGLLSASIPAWVASRDRLMDAVNAVARGMVRRSRALTALVIADVALVSVLLVLTALALATFIRISTADQGFDRQHTMSIWYHRSLDGVPERDLPAAVRAFEQVLLTTTASVPDVTGVALSGVGAPLAGSRTGARIGIPGYGRTTGADVDAKSVSAGYFRVLGVDLLRGRLIEPADRAGTPRVMVINDVAAERYFTGRDPLGQIVDDNGPVAIVGIVRGTRVEGPEVGIPPQIYTSWDQNRARVFGGTPREGGRFTSGGLLVRTRGNPRDVLPDVEHAILPLLGGRQPDATTFVDDLFADRTVRRRLMAIVLACFGTIGLGVAALGIYGTMTFFVTSHLRSAAVRLALGASPASIRRSILVRALSRVGSGLAIGLTGAWGASSTFRSLVFGLEPTDPVVYATVAGFVLCVGLLAALGPAIRAGRVDPAALLRQE